MSETDRIALQPGPAVVRVHWGEHLLADTREAIELAEHGYPPRLYLPMAAVSADWLVVSKTTTHCPFKGDATYYHVQIDGEQLDDAAWCYAQPIDSVAEIAGHVCFDHEALTVDTQADADA